MAEVQRLYFTPDQRTRLQEIIHSNGEDAQRLISAAEFGVNSYRFAIARPRANLKGYKRKTMALRNEAQKLDECLTWLQQRAGPGTRVTLQPDGTYLRAFGFTLGRSFISLESRSCLREWVEEADKALAEMAKCGMGPGRFCAPERMIAESIIKEWTPRFGRLSSCPRSRLNRFVSETLDAADLCGVDVEHMLAEVLKARASLPSPDQTPA